MKNLDIGRLFDATAATDSRHDTAQSTPPLIGDDILTLGMGTMDLRFSFTCAAATRWGPLGYDFTGDWGGGGVIEHDIHTSLTFASAVLE